MHDAAAEAIDLLDNDPGVIDSFPGDYGATELAGKDALITGWGANAYQVGGSSDDLEEIIVPIRSDTECAATSVSSAAVASRPST